MGVDIEIIEAFYKRFRSLAPSGSMELETFKRSLGILVTFEGSVLASSLFEAFDFRNDGTLDFVEWIYGLQTLMGGEKIGSIDLSYRIFSGGKEKLRIDRFGLVLLSLRDVENKIFTASNRSRGSFGHIAIMFHEYSKFKDFITVEEFKGLIADPILLRLLGVVDTSAPWQTHRWITSHRSGNADQDKLIDLLSELHSWLLRCLIKLSERTLYSSANADTLLCDSSDLCEKSLLNKRISSRSSLMGRLSFEAEGRSKINKTVENKQSLRNQNSCRSTSATNSLGQHDVSESISHEGSGGESGGQPPQGPAYPASASLYSLSMDLPDLIRLTNECSDTRHTSCSKLLQQKSEIPDEDPVYQEDSNTSMQKRTNHDRSYPNDQGIRTPQISSRLCRGNDKCDNEECTRKTTVGAREKATASLKTTNQQRGMSDEPQTKLQTMSTPRNSHYKLRSYHQSSSSRPIIGHMNTNHDMQLRSSEGFTVLTDHHDLSIIPHALSRQTIDFWQVLEFLVQHLPYLTIAYPSSSPITKEAVKKLAATVTLAVDNANAFGIFLELAHIIQQIVMHPRECQESVDPHGNKSSKFNRSVIHFGHGSWNHILSIIIGITTSKLFSSSSSVDDRNTESPVRCAFPSFFSHRVNRKLGAIVPGFTEYNSAVFKTLRRLYGATDYYDSIGPRRLIGNLLIGNLRSLSELYSEGKSGSTFYYSYDNKYVIKTVHSSDIKHLISMLPQYYKHMVQNCGKTLLNKIFGLYKLQFSRNLQMYLVVMQNVLFNDLEFVRKYDLKGSWIGRSSESTSSLTCPSSRTGCCRDNSMASAAINSLKDRDILSDPGYLNVSSTDAAAVHAILSHDTKLLEQLNIIDYSLLIGVYKISPFLDAHKTLSTNISDRNIILSLSGEHIYQLGIIDILTKYNSYKRTEHMIKSIYLDRNGISCVNPVLYRERFLRFMRTALSCETPDR